MHRRSMLPFDPKAGSQPDQLHSAQRSGAPVIEGQLLAGRVHTPTRSTMAAAILRILVGTRAARRALPPIPAGSEPADKEQPVEWAMRLMS